MKYLNIAAYKFVKLNDLSALRTALKNCGNENNIRGTILLSPEGINIMLCGLTEEINSFRQYLANYPEFADIYYKESYSEDITYNRFLVKIKKEIIAFGIAEVNPLENSAPYVTPQELKEWLEKHKDIILLDTRNDYEIKLGTFENATDLNIHHFRDFPKAVSQMDPVFKEKTIVTFCTGGIRCEKAALYMQQQGFKHVYQLEGGILDYFKACGGEHYKGECFVFDRRVGVDPHLEETGTKQCFACLAPLTAEEQHHPYYKPDHHCPQCIEKNS